jgi:hypothetical protein
MLAHGGKSGGGGRVPSGFPRLKRPPSRSAREKVEKFHGTAANREREISRLLPRPGGFEGSSGVQWKCASLIFPSLSR